MARSRWNWLLFPVGFSIVYEAMTWFCWVPLNSAVVTARNGAVFIPYWQGQVFAFAAIRIFGLVLLLLFCLALPVRRWEAFLLGAATGLFTSVLDRFWWDWVNDHLGFFVALFGMPLVSGGLAVSLFRLIESRRGHVGLST
jgi:hypothetical protein